MEIKIRKVFHDKNPKLAKLLPGFIYKYIEHVVHEDEINDILRRHGHKVGIEFSQAALKDFDVKVEVRGIENVQPNNKYLFISNHPLGGFDGILLMNTITKHFGNVKVLVNDILMNIKNLEPMFLPINKHGGHSKEAAIAIDEAFDSEIHILTFPAGLCSRKNNGRIEDLEWKKNFISKSIASKRDIVPIFFSGKNSNFFYNLSKLRNKLGIKANIEMFFLVDELFKHKHKTFTITFGKPLSYKLFSQKKTHKEWAELIKKHVYKLEKNPTETFLFN
jgi:putative hemolysin